MQLIDCSFYCGKLINDSSKSQTFSQIISFFDSFIHLFAFMNVSGYIKKIISNANGFTNFERARNKFLYSQNLYETYSITEKKTKVKRKGAKRGTYRKHK